MGIVDVVGILFSNVGCICAPVCVRHMVLSCLGIISLACLYAFACSICNSYVYGCYIVWSVALSAVISQSGLCARVCGMWISAAVSGRALWAQHGEVWCEAVGKLVRSRQL